MEMDDVYQGEFFQPTPRKSSEKLQKFLHAWWDFEDSFPDHAETLSVKFSLFVKDFRPDLFEQFHEKNLDTFNEMFDFVSEAIFNEE